MLCSYNFKIQNNTEIVTLNEEIVKYEKVPVPRAIFLLLS